MLIETNWLNMLVDKDENKYYVIQAEQVWFGNHIPGHLGIVFYDGDFFHGATAPSGPGPPHCRGFTITFRHTALGRTPLDERHPCNRWDSKPQTQQASGGGPTTWTVWPLGSALLRGMQTWTVAVDKNGYTLRRAWELPGRKRIWFWNLRLTVDENWYPQCGEPHISATSRAILPTECWPKSRET
jgi:hypothetical protein